MGNLLFSAEGRASLPEEPPTDLPDFRGSDVFRTLDLNRDGSLSSKEIRLLSMTLGEAYEPLTADESAILARAFSTGGKKEVGCDDFVKVWDTLLAAEAGNEPEPKNVPAGDLILLDLIRIWMSQQPWLPVDVRDQEELLEVLQEAGVDTEMWGGMQTKSVAGLFEEISSEEVTLMRKKDDPTRIMRVIDTARVRVYRSEWKQSASMSSNVLMESYELTATGRLRKRFTFLSRNVRPNQSAKDAARAGLKAQLRVTTNQIKTEKGDMGTIMQYKVSSRSYPGLSTVYRLHDVKAYVSGLPKTPFYCAQEVSEKDAHRVSKAHYWEWVNDNKAISILRGHVRRSNSVAPEGIFDAMPTEAEVNNEEDEASAMFVSLEEWDGMPSPFPEDDKDIIAEYTSTWTQVHVCSLHRAKSGSCVVQVNGEDEMGAKPPMVFKLGTPRLIQHEYESCTKAREYAGHGVPAMHAPLTSESKKRAGIPMDVIGPRFINSDAMSRYHVTALEDIYKTEVEIIAGGRRDKLENTVNTTVMAVIHEALGSILRKMLKGTHKVHVGMKDGSRLCDVHYPLLQNIDRFIYMKVPASKSDKTNQMTPERLELIEGMDIPLTQHFKSWVAEFRIYKYYFPQKYNTHLSHGDLVASNIVVDSSQNVSLIDFEKTSVQHSLSDIAKLETSFLFQHLQTEGQSEEWHECALEMIKDLTFAGAEFNQRFAEGRVFILPSRERELLEEGEEEPEDFLVPADIAFCYRVCLCIRGYARRYAEYGQVAAIDSDAEDEDSTQGNPRQWSNKLSIEYTTALLHHTLPVLSYAELTEAHQLRLPAQAAMYYSRALVHLLKVEEGSATAETPTPADKKKKDQAKKDQARGKSTPVARDWNSSTKSAKKEDKGSVAHGSVAHGSVAHAKNKSVSADDANKEGKEDTFERPVRGGAVDEDEETAEQVNTRITRDMLVYLRDVMVKFGSLEDPVNGERLDMLEQAINVRLLSVHARNSISTQSLDLQDDRVVKSLLDNNNADNIGDALQYVISLAEGEQKDKEKKTEKSDASKDPAAKKAKPAAAPGSPAKKGPGSPTKKSRPAPKPVSSADIPHLLILGNPASGKSVLCKKLAVLGAMGQARSMKQQIRVPIHINLQDLVHAIQRNEAEPEQYQDVISLYLEHTYGPFSTISRLYRENTINARFLIVLDGFDEIPERYKTTLVSYITERFHRHHVEYGCYDINGKRSCSIPESKDLVVVTSRPASIPSLMRWFRVWHWAIVRPLDLELQNEIAILRLGDKSGQFLNILKKNETYQTLASSPLLLMLLIHLYKDKGRLPSNKLKLYQYGIDIFLSWMDKKKQISNDRRGSMASATTKKEDPPPEPVVRDFLEYLAYDHYCRMEEPSPTITSDSGREAEEFWLSTLNLRARTVKYKELMKSNQAENPTPASPEPAQPAEPAEPASPPPKEPSAAVKAAAATFKSVTKFPKNVWRYVESAVSQGNMSLLSCMGVYTRLDGRSANLYRFVHLTFHEFLAASHVARSLRTALLASVLSPQMAGGSLTFKGGPDKDIFPETCTKTFTRRYPCDMLQDPHNDTFFRFLAAQMNADTFVRFVLWLQSLTEDDLAEARIRVIDVITTERGLDGFAEIMQAVSQYGMRRLELCRGWVALLEESADAREIFLNGITDPECTLKTLDIRNSTISIDLLPPVCQALNQSPISHLSMFNNSLYTDGGRELAGALYTGDDDSESATPVERLEIANNHIGDASLRDLSLVISAPSCAFTHVSLPFNDIGPDGGLYLGHALRENTTIRSLNLAGNRLGGLGVIQLADGIMLNKTVTKLDLSSNGLDQAAADMVGRILKDDDTIQEIRLSRNALGDKGFESIARGLSKNNAVTLIELTNCELGDPAGKLLASLIKVNGALRTVNLSNNHIKRAGAEIRHALEMDPYNRQLTVYLQHNPCAMK